jgi:serine/threonine protein phosphatase PrpC
VCAQRAGPSEGGGARPGQAAPGRAAAVGVAGEDMSTAPRPCCTWVEAPPSAVADQTRLACGSGADVFKGTVATAGGARRVVALRRPRIVSSAALDRFEREVTLRGGLDHPHILPLISACTKPPQYCTVSPWMAGGDVFDAVHARGARFDFDRTLRLATQLARAMAYLHSLHIVHRDLKSANVLLDRDLANASVADLDLAIAVETLREQASIANGRAMHRGPSNGRLSHMVGTLVYLAPEVLLGASHTYAADVYAFAVTVNEIASAAVPYVDRELPAPELHTVLETRFSDSSLRRAITKDHLRPVPAAGVPPEFSALIARAWMPDPGARPTFDAIVEELGIIAAKGEAYLSTFPASTGNSAAGDAAAGDAVNRTGAPSKLVAELAACAAAPQKPSWAASGRAAQRATSPRPHVPVVSGGISSTCGDRGEDRMEDTAIVCHRLAGLPDAHLFAVFDGHGGAVCSQYAADTLPAAIFRSWARPESDPVSVLVHAFQDTDTAFLQSTPASDQSGCTAVAALILGPTLFVANAGDCRCVLGRTDGSAVVVTVDHVATDPDERARVEARGGRVDAKTGRVQGRLMVSRAMGDRRLKRFVPPTPDVFTVHLTPEHDFAVLASDGLWDVVDSAAAVALVRSTARSADLAAKRLALKAIELGSGDNVSVVVIHFDSPAAAEAAVVL